jgi:hypothetical protein
MESATDKCLWVIMEWIGATKKGAHWLERKGPAKNRGRGYDPPSAAEEHETATQCPPPFPV